MAAGSAGEGAGSNTEHRLWRRLFNDSRLACQSEMALAKTKYNPTNLVHQRGKTRTVVRDDKVKDPQADSRRDAEGQIEMATVDYTSHSMTEM